MKAYRIEKKITENGTLQLSALPFSKGELVEVIILSAEDKSDAAAISSLRGQVIEYKDPTEPVAEEDWIS